MAVEPIKELIAPWGTYTTKDGILSLGNIRRQSIAIGASSSLAVTLDDTDGSLKTVYNTEDLIGQEVTVNQKYEGGVPATHVIFYGVIHGGISWSESDRTLSFDVETLTRSDKVGIQPADEYDNEGKWVPEGWPWAIIDNERQLYKSNIGKVWPQIYGTARHVKALQLTKPLTGKLELDSAEFIDQDTLSFKVTNGSEFEQGVETKIRVGTVSYQGTFSGDTFTVSIANGKAQFPDGGIFSDKLLPRQDGDADDVNNYVLWIETHFYIGRSFLVLEQNLETPDPNQDIVVKVKFQQGRKLFLEAPSRFLLDDNYKIKHFTGALAAGDLPGDNMHVNEDAGNLLFLAEKWKIQKGAKVISLSEGTQWHIVDDQPNALIHSVSAYRTQDGIRTLEPLPESYYIEELNTVVDADPCTCIKLGLALSEILDEGWEDTLYVTASNTTRGYNPAEIIKNLLTTHTSLTVDTASFDAVELLVNDYPVGFVLPEQKDAIKFCEEIAWQTRCRLVAVGATVGIEYLSQVPTSVRTLGENTALERTLEAGFTNPDDLVTTIRADWREDGSEEGARKISYTKNVDKYGTIEKTVNFYVYNQPLLIGRSLSFWGYRMANLWRTVSVEVPHTGDEWSINKAYTISISDYSVNNSIGDLEGVDSVSRESDKLTFIMPQKIADLLTQNDDYWLGDPTNPVAASFTLPNLIADSKKLEYIVPVTSRKQPSIKTVAVKNKSGRIVKQFDVMICNNKNENAVVNDGQMDCTDVQELSATADEMIVVDSVTADGDPSSGTLANGGPIRVRYFGDAPVAQEIWGPLPIDIIENTDYFPVPDPDDLEKGAIHTEGSAFVILGMVDTEKKTVLVTRSYRKPDTFLRINSFDQVPKKIGEGWGGVKVMGHGYKVVGVVVRYTGTLTFRILRNGVLLHAQLDNLTQASNKNLLAYPIDIDLFDLISAETIVDPSDTSIDFECTLQLAHFGASSNTLLEQSGLA